MPFSNKAWISHQLGNNARGGYNDRFLNATRSGKICLEDVVERQLRKNSRARKLEDPHAKYSKRSSNIDEPGYSFQGLLGAFGEVVPILTLPSLAPNIPTPPSLTTQIMSHFLKLQPENPTNNPTKNPNHVPQSQTTTKKSNQQSNQIPKKTAQPIEQRLNVMLEN